MNEKQNPWMYVSILLGVLLVVSMAQNFLTINNLKGITVAANNNNQPTVGAQPSPAPQQPTGPAARANLAIPSYAVPYASKNANINVIEFGDYQCPFCERFFTQSEPQLITDYVKTNKVNYYFFDFAFLGPDSTTLSEGAWCAADQSKYYEYRNYVYSHQGQEQSGWGTPDKVKAIAANVGGIDATKFASCLDSNKYKTRVTELTSLGQQAGVTGTPSLLIGNKDKGYTILVGAVPYTQIKTAIDAELNG
ncbi:MAG: DsbA family protein [Nanoarchaeota archaeon]|nr:MAG: DsbA family protein [Nanoarchaeota archaeon]